MSSFLIPSPDSDYLSLSADPQVKLYPDQKGRLFRKQIFKMNSQFIHPADKSIKIKTDKAFAEKLAANFKRSGNIVQLPLCNDKNEHVEGADKNLGRVLDVQYDDKGVYAILDARRHAEDFGDIFLGSSAFVDLNFEDKETGERIGPTLLHVAVTNRPYLTNLDEYSEVTKLSADNSGEDPILLTPVEESDQEPKKQKKKVAKLAAEQPKVIEKETSMDMESVKAWLNERGFTAVKADEYTDLQTKAAKATELSAKLEETNNQLKLSETEKLDIETVGNALVELSAANDDLTKTVEAQREEIDQMKLSAAETEIEGYISSGRILPKQKDVMVKLYLSDRATFDELLPEESLVTLSEHGVTVHEKPKTNGLTDDDRKRYQEMASRLGGKRKN